jgi:hypothetical protein
MPAVNPQRGFVDLVVMSHAADYAFGRGILFGAVKHCQLHTSNCNQDIPQAAGARFVLGNATMHLPQRPVKANDSHGLDAVTRLKYCGFCSALHGWLHASMSFWAPPGVWATQDRSTGTAAYILGFHYIHMFRLAAFFFMAGFFGRLVYHRRGLGGFLRDRCKRILVPLVCGWMVIYPLIVLVWIWGAVRSGAVLSPGTEKLPVWQIWIGALATGAVFRDGIRPAHLWFLYYLLQMYVLVLVARPLLGAAAHRRSTAWCAW